MVPEGWLSRSIDDNITFSGGSQPPREVFVDEPKEGYVRLIQIRDYKSDKFATYIPEKLAKKFCTASDVMIGRYGPPIFQILRGIEGAYNVALIKATPKECVDQEYMYYFLSREPLLRVIESHSQRTSGQTGIEMDVLKSYPMPIPPEGEQKKIVQILSTWDKAIITTEQLLANSQQQKKALMQRLLTGKKRLLDQSGVRFGGEWKHGRISDLGKVAKGKALSSKDLLDGDYPVIAGGKMSPYKHKNFTHEKVITVSASGAYAGYVAYHPYKIWASDCSVVVNNSNSDIGFIYQFMKYMQEKIYSLQSGGAQPHVYPKDLEVLRVHIPSTEEQNKISTVLFAADQEISALQQQLVLLKKEKSALMQQLLTGKRRVKIN